jgi:hypothetical protein
VKARFSILIILLSFLAHAQDGKLLHGRVAIRSATPDSIHVINLNTERETLTDREGRFAIRANAGDVLVLKNERVDMMRKIVSDDDYRDGTLLVSMTSSVTQLEQVDIQVDDRINPVALGILSKPAKKYTPAERRLYTATSTQIDALINLISGRKKRLKNDVKTEKKIMLLQELDGLFPESYYTESLCIDKDMIRGFQYFVAEDKPFSEALRQKNKSLAAFRLIELARDFNTRHAQP